MKELNKNINKNYSIPDGVELKESPLHGLGFFATKFIPKNSKIGIGHYYTFNSDYKYIRLPFVAFVNYDTNPNSKLDIEKKVINGKTSTYTMFITKKDINEGEELTLRYTWYDPTKPDTEDNRHYLPLPNNVSIKNNNGEYQLYAKEDIDSDFVFGPSFHFYRPSNLYEPNPIGGYIVESTSPNCVLYKVGNDLHLKTIKKIKKDDLITVDYEKILFI